MDDGIRTEWGGTLGALLRARKGPILAEWEGTSRSRGHAHGLSRPALLDDVPDLLERIADMADDAAGATAPGRSLPEARKHGLERLEQGFDLAEVVAEYALLRQVLLRNLESTAFDDSSRLRIVHQAIDDAVAAAASHYVRARDRTLQALDRISAAALSTRDLGRLIPELLSILVQCAPAVDSSAILLRDGDRLRVRATIGLDGDLSNGPQFEIGQGFAGRIASERRPLLLHDAASDPLVEHDAIRAQGIHALYGVPMIDDERLFGIAFIGSRSAYEFPSEDLHLFRATVDRATSVLARAQQTEREGAALNAAENAHREIRERTAQIQALLEVSLDAIVGMDAAGRVSAWNPAAERIFGRAREEALGGRMDELIVPPRLREKHRQGLSRYLATGKGKYMNRRVELSGLRSDGSEFPVELTITQVPSHDPPVFIGFLRDISDRKVAEERQKRMLDETREAVLTREDVLAVVSHDLRNPLGAILMSTAMLERQCQDVTSGRQVETIRRSARRMQVLLDDLLDMAKIRAGRFSIERRVTDLRELVDEAVRLHESRAREKRIHLAVDMSDAGVDGVPLDRNRMLQVFSNLLDNAIRFCRPGGSVSVAAERKGHEVRLSVADEGPGIRREDLPRIFDPYWSAREHTGGGTGLGLFISEGIVRAHGGRIWAESPVGTGATFHFTLPLDASGS